MSPDSDQTAFWAIELSCAPDKSVLMTFFGNYIRHEFNTIIHLSAIRHAIPFFVNQSLIVYRPQCGLLQPAA
jgi:hypothetical protein